MLCALYKHVSWNLLEQSTQHVSSQSLHTWYYWNLLPSRCSSCCLRLSRSFVTAVRSRFSAQMRSFCLATASDAPIEDATFSARVREAQGLLDCSSASICHRLVHHCPQKGGWWVFKGWSVNSIAVASAPWHHTECMRQHLAIRYHIVPQTNTTIPVHPVLFLSAKSEPQFWSMYRRAQALGLSFRFRQPGDTLNQLTFSFSTGHKIRGLAAHLILCTQEKEGSWKNSKGPDPEARAAIWKLLRSLSSVCSASSLSFASAASLCSMTASCRVHHSIT